MLWIERARVKGSAEGRFCMKGEAASGDEELPFCKPRRKGCRIPGQGAGPDQLNRMGMIRMARMLTTLIIGLTAGPAVSL